VSSQRCLFSAVPPLQERHISFQSFRYFVLKMVENADSFCYFEHIVLMEEGRQDNFLCQIPFFSEYMGASLEEATIS